MDWIYPLASIIVIIGLAFLLGWTRTRVKSPAAQVAIWIGSILALLALRFGFTRSWEFCLLLLALALDTLDHIPHWLGYMVATVIIGFVFRHWLILIATSITELAREIEITRSRIQLMEQSIEDKLHDIARRLPE
jgi:hypothetical protein